MNDLELLGDLIVCARKAGADAADAVLVGGASLSVQRRLGKTEHVERSETRDLGLRVFVGQQIAIVSASTVDPASFAELAERAVAMARVVPEDPYSGLADPVTPDDSSALELSDGVEPTVEDLVARAAAAEEAALAVAGVTNSEGADAGFSRAQMALVNSAGFVGQAVRSSHSISAVALAGSGTGMQRDYDFHSTVHLADLDDPAGIGRRAGERAVARLNPTRPATGKMTVVYDPRVSGGLVGHLAGAINGAAIARRTSFLLDKLGARIFAPGIVIRDDPRRRRGMRSRVFDAEGVRTTEKNLVEDGVLMGWLLDLRSARQLGMRSTGHASRGTSGPPSPAPSNLFMAAGTLSPAELMADIKLGIYVTELVGMGVNGLTGDYSRGAAGFVIRDGKLAEPVAEITIAGNLLEIFSHLTPANDLVFRRGTDAPTVRVESLTMAGS
jgi:PmbA protein